MQSRLLVSVFTAATGIACLLPSDGLPHTERMHLTERFTRLDFSTLKYEVTIDDPGAYTAIWSSGFNMRWTEGQELFEYVCQDNNHFPESVFAGTAELIQ